MSDWWDVLFALRVFFTLWCSVNTVSPLHPGPRISSFVLYLSLSSLFRIIVYFLLEKTKCTYKLNILRLFLSLLSVYPYNINSGREKYKLCIVLRPNKSGPRHDIELWFSYFVPCLSENHILSTDSKISKVFDRFLRRYRRFQLERVPVRVPIFSHPPENFFLV
jgi:hypothetical protein